MMLSECMVPDNWTSDTYGQSDDDWIESARAGIYLALCTLKQNNLDKALEQVCLDYLGNYAAWRRFGAILQSHQIEYLLRRDYDDDWSLYQDEISSRLLFTT